MQIVVGLGQKHSACTRNNIHQDLFSIINYLQDWPDVISESFISKSWQGAGKNSTDSCHRAECAAIRSEYSKDEWFKV